MKNGLWLQMVFVNTSRILNIHPEDKLKLSLKSGGLLYRFDFSVALLN